MSKMKADELVEKWNKSIRKMEEEKVFKEVIEEYRFTIKVQLNHRKCWVHDREQNRRVSPKFETTEEAMEFRAALRKRLGKIT